MAKDYFKDHNIEFKDFDVGADLEKRKEMVEKSGQMGVPVIDIEGTILVGFDQVEIDKALA
jgi:glutaredoxin